MKEIPRLVDFDAEQPIEIETEKGILRMFPLRYKRGVGRNKWRVAIQGICHSNAELIQHCHVLFQGREIEGKFSKIKAANYLWQVTFETVIPAPEFWAAT